MLEIADRLLTRLHAGRRVAVATVVSVTGSSPSVVGTSMAVDDTGAVVGSIAGGCVEGAVYEMCAEVLGGLRSRAEDFGVSDDDAFAAGLTCGGLLRIHARELGPDDVPSLRLAASGAEAVLVTPLDDRAGERSGAAKNGRDLRGTGAGPAGSSALADAVGAQAARGRSGLVRLSPGDGREVEVFVEVRTPPPHLVVYGALEFGAALARLARAADHRVTVCDPRPVLATPDRVPGAHVVVAAWPPRHLAGLALGPRDAVCVLGHDDRYEAELVLAALRSPAGYVGAMGSRRTHGRRVAALQALGATEAEISRLRSPIGLDLGGSSPAETAVSVLAEILAARTGATARPLSELDGAIHRPEESVVG